MTTVPSPALPSPWADPEKPNARIERLRNPSVTQETPERIDGIIAVLSVGGLAAVGWLAFPSVEAAAEEMLGRPRSRRPTAFNQIEEGAGEHFPTA